MTGTDDATPLEDYLDDLLRTTHADPRTTRRLLDEAGDHLHTATAHLRSTGMTRVAAEREAVRRLGDVADLSRGATRRSLAGLAAEVARAAVLLLACGLVAVGLSGALVAGMSAAFGSRFVGGTTVLGTAGGTVAETAQDAVSLRVLAGLVGLMLLGLYALVRRRFRPAAVLPRGLVDILAACAFAEGTAVLAGALVDQALTATGGHGVGWFLSGAVVCLAGAIVFGTRAVRSLLSSPLTTRTAQADRA